MNHPFELGGAPNLDDFSTDERDILGTAKVMGQYQRYLVLKASAMEHRSAGRIDAAKKDEDEMENIFCSLPLWARW